MIDSIRQVLEDSKSIAGYTLIERKLVSTQLYSSFGETESFRKVEDLSYHLEIFSKNELPDGRQMMGSSRLELSSDEPRLKSRIETAVMRARTQDNPIFELPAPGIIYPDFDDADKQIQTNPWETIDYLSDQLAATSKEESKIRISSSEFFLKSFEYRLLNHKGLDLVQYETDLLWDIVLLYNNGQYDSEFWSIYNRPGLAYFNIPQDFRKFARYAIDASKAVIPETGECPVVLTGDSLVVLFQYLLYHSSAASKFAGSSLFKLGKPILKGEPAGDTITMYSNAILHGGTSSYRFDSSGLPGARTMIIDENILKQFWASKQYADYLGLSPTGEFANFDISPGSLSWADMFKGHQRVILVLQFSTFDPQPVSGNYMGEIRVGYEFHEDGSVIPLRGGSVSGNLADGLLDCHLCKETETFSGYHGPRGIRFNKAQVAGI